VLNWITSGAKLNYKIKKNINFFLFYCKLIIFVKKQQENEVDFVIENEDGKYICIEVKSAQNITDDDLKGLKIFYNLNKENIQAMYLFYGGATISARKIADSSIVLLPHHFLF